MECSAYARARLFVQCMCQGFLSTIKETVDGALVHASLSDGYVRGLFFDHIQGDVGLLFFIASCCAFRFVDLARIVSVLCLVVLFAGVWQ